MTHTWCERLDRVLIRHGGALIGDRSDLLRRARQPVEIASCGIVALQKLRCYNGVMTNESVRLLGGQMFAALALDPQAPPPVKGIALTRAPHEFQNVDRSLA
jgi:hypothetical protein